MSDIDPFATFSLGDDPSETTYAQGRLTEYTYASRSFTVPRPQSSDYGRPARFVYKVFDNGVESTVELEGTEWTVAESPGGRVQIKLLITREAGNVKELWIQRVPAPGSTGTVKLGLHLKQPEVQQLFDLLHVVENLPIVGEASTRIDDSVIRRVLADPAALDDAYLQNRDRFRDLITNDVTASDVIAVAHRREQVAIFHRMMEEPDYFEERRQQTAGKSAERVWQMFFEANPWILGLGLGAQLLTSWDKNKLEQAVTGFSISGPGKRADALMQTAGRIRSMVFAEFKIHTTDLLQDDDYRSGCWAASDELAGGVAQSQGTVHRAVMDVRERLAETDESGAERLGEFAYFIRPKSYLLIGQLSELIGDSGGHHVDKIRSFELFRRNLNEPEIITYDELLARADWLVDNPTMAADVPPASPIHDPWGTPVIDPWGEAPF